ncbi:MAG: GTP 3',8-cyclase MoaA [Phycisphaerales bacterium]|nr:GTP 3',8-cyclase MoaA [Phycisphaerales bacterium]
MLPLVLGAAAPPTGALPGGALALPQIAAGVPARGGAAPPESPPAVRAGGRLIDSYGRTIRDLRISITDRCNFRCIYCMEPDVRFAPRESLLTVPEIVRIAAIAESLGVCKVRLTGGEPTLRPDLASIIAGIRRETAVEIAMITNGSLLSREALAEWKAAGLTRLTVSIDSLRPERFARLTRSTSSPADVLAGVEAALNLNLTPLKLNAVLLRGVNDDEAADLAALARRPSVEMRFIEYMPLDSGHTWDGSTWVSAAETRAAIEARFPLAACDDDDPRSTAQTFAFADGSPGRVGFIAPVSSPFCGACSRLRVTADGKVRPCLFSTTEWDIRPLLRGGAADREIREFLIDATWTKQAGHGIRSPEFRQPARPMSAIGG